MFEIEKGVPIPARPNRDSRWGVLFKMEPGDSFLAPANSTREIDSLRSGVGQFARSKGFTITVRVVPGGLRIWKLRGPDPYKAALCK